MRPDRECRDPEGNCSSPPGPRISLLDKFSVKVERRILGFAADWAIRAGRRVCRPMEQSQQVHTRIGSRNWLSGICWPAPRRQAR